MISYEIAMGLAISSVIVTYGTLELQDIVRGTGRCLVRLSAALGNFLAAGLASFSCWSPGWPNPSASPSTCPRASPS